ncbi:hypothetical protein GYMLUDRAFT_250964 [Collybiopsis luxurians FD-317 M1]|uniref:Uncharacterized protein n=1 Tax=Collybiopsis luxurians FD-317 M1 TaxID=944289 RepID=A0A0D0BSV9_9AGAR|nr:hypothetical protein GYMLUDRAFT_250964 [Collybiopsis luxurians FD-317 M1]
MEWLQYFVGMEPQNHQEGGVLVARAQTCLVKILQQVPPGRDERKEAPFPYCEAGSKEGAEGLEDEKDLEGEEDPEGKEDLEGEEGLEGTEEYPDLQLLIDGLVDKEVQEGGGTWRGQDQIDILATKAVGHLHWCDWPALDHFPLEDYAYSYFIQTLQ